MIRELPRFSALSMTLMFGACSMPASNSMPSTVVNAPSVAVGQSISKHYLFVANLTGGSGSGFGSVTYYAPRKKTATGTISTSSPTAMVFDRNGHLFVTNIEGYGSVSVYNPGGSSAYTISDGVNSPLALAIDPSQNLYVANSGDPTNSVTVYKPGTMTVWHTITSGVDYPSAMVIDRLGNLYVANGSANTVTVYKAGRTQPWHIITLGIKSPTALVLDKSGNLYVANQSGAVTEYAFGTTKLIRSLDGSYNSPFALAIDPSGNLYVADGNGVTIFKNGEGTGWKTIGMQATALAVDPAGTLYVAQQSHNLVTAYKLASTSQSEIITDGINNPEALAVFPQ
ncbi:MAG TPA: NHL repeat-containing protein [Candidatus Acidoferrales bacterium]|nr:NHL repeat-containing protein [Candidatus Acidoferrales bacterium]